MKQTDQSLDLRSRRTRKRAILEEIERVVLWNEFVAMISQMGVPGYDSVPGTGDSGPWSVFLRN